MREAGAGGNAEPVDADALVKLAASIADPKAAAADAPVAGAATGARHRAVHGRPAPALPVAAGAAARGGRDPRSGLGRGDRSAALGPRWREPWKSPTSGCTNGSSPTKPPRVGPSPWPGRKTPPPITTPSRS